jgi:hypothetical protein
MSEDPKLFDAGDYNFFRYCHNDPVDKTDPTGLIDESHRESAELESPVEGTRGRFLQSIGHDIAQAYREQGPFLFFFNVAMVLSRGGPKIESAGLRGVRDLRPTTNPGRVATGFRYVGVREAETIAREKTIPMVDLKGNPKPVFYTDEKFTLGTVAHKELELTGSVPTHRAEFDLAQAPAGYGSLTGNQRVEFTLREGAEPIRVNRLVPLDDALSLEPGIDHPQILKLDK